jgi:transposase
MDDKKLMQITLGVPSPWFVKSVELNTSEERIDVYFDFIKGSEFACPICNKPCKIHDTKDRSWRHLPLFHYESYIHARVPRTKCEEHGTKTVVIPWSRSDTGFTSLFEADVLALGKEMSVASVAGRVKIHEESAWRILAYHVNEAIERVDLSQLDTIGVDEISVKKGHKYITLFYDIKNAKVIYIGMGKGKNAIKQFKE